MATDEPDPRSSYLGHVAELAQRSKVIIIALFISTIFFMLFPADPLDLLNPSSWLTGFYRPMVSVMLENIKAYVAPPGLQIISLQIGDPLEVYIFASILLGLVVSSPVIGYEVYMFVNPALLDEERRSIYPFVLGFSGCFILGAAFGYLFLAPIIGLTMILFSGFIGAQPVITALDFYSMIFISILFTGFGFTIPAIFVLLVKLGVVGTSILTENRVIFYIVLFGITALVTADGGPLADLFLCVPIVLLTEVSIVIARRIEKNRIRAQLESGEVPEGICRFCGTRFRGEEIFCRKCGKSRE